LPAQNSQTKVFSSFNTKSEITLTHPKTQSSISLYYKHNGVQQFYVTQLDESIKIAKTSAYTLLDATLNLSFFKKRITLNTGIKNILNIKTINSTNTATIHGSSPNTTLIAPGQSYFVGLKIDWSK
jgi:outer membrane receptor for ferrienterochelin and colicins